MIKGIVLALLIYVVAPVVAMVVCSAALWLLYYIMGGIRGMVGLVVVGVIALFVWAYISERQK